MAISLVDNPGSATRINSQVSSVNYTGLTISSGIFNSVAIFALCVNNHAVTISTPTWNGVNCTLIGNTALSLQNLALYGIFNPAAGNQTFAASWTGGTGLVQVVGCSFAGVSGFANFTSFDNSSTTGPNTINVTTTPIDYTFGAAALGQNAGSPPFTSSPSGTTICSDDGTATTGVDFIALAIASTGTSTSYTGRNGATADAMAIVGFDLVAAIGWAAAEY